MSSQSMHTAAFVLSLIGGILIIAFSAIGVISAFVSPYGPYYWWGPGMMSGFGFGYGYGYSSGWVIGLSIAALVFGILVVIGAIMLNVRPAEHIAWGIIILIFSIASFIGGIGCFMGAILGIAGGAVALSYRTHT